MSKDWGLRWCAYEISNPGVDLEEMSRVKEVTGVERRRNARKCDEVAENIECALYTTWLRILLRVRCQDVICAIESAYKSQFFLNSADDTPPLCEGDPWQSGYTDL